MRESKNKSRKTNDDSEGNNSASLQMEMELTAVKAKNADLIKAHTKLVQENSEMRNQIYSLQAELVDLQAKYNNVESVLKNVEQNMKRCTPNLIDVLNLFLQVADSRKNSFNTLNMTDRVSDRGFTPKAKVITHTVKPHTVNGTVLNLVPTISLTRMNSTHNTNETSNEVSSTNVPDDYRNSPSTSADNMEEDHIGNLSLNLNSSELENQSFVSRRKNTNTRDTYSNVDFGDEDDDNDDEIDHSSDESDPEEENLSRLSPIQEESVCSSGRKRTSLGEVRIYLSRLSAEDMQVRRSVNTSFSSTDANVNDTCLNIETTVIENAENRASKRLRADIMVFSPHTNSTRMGSDDSVLSELSPDNRRKISVPAVSAIQSAEVTPSTSVVNDTNELLASSKMTWLPTPSLSALGDIDTSASKLEILKELGLTPSPSTLPVDKIEETEHSTLLSATPQRLTRSCKTRSRSKSDGVTPESSAENRKEKKGTRKLAKVQKGISDARPLTPTIVLERVDNILPERRLTANSINIQILAPADQPEENENPPKKSKNTTRSKKSVKRKLKEEDEAETESLHAKIREIKIRLSNYVPEESENTIVESPKEGKRRPARAAKPKSLKDASLKGKLRRMF